jgi:hypothetical protein
MKCEDQFAILERFASQIFPPTPEYSGLTFHAKTLREICDQMFANKTLQGYLKKHPL